jgi:hypothetical protein
VGDTDVKEPTLSSALAISRSYRHRFNAPFRQPSFIQAAPNNKSPTMPIDDNGILCPWSSLEVLRYQHTCFDIHVMNRLVNKINLVER